LHVFSEFIISGMHEDMDAFRNAETQDMHEAERILEILVLTLGEIPKLRGNC